MLHQTLQHLAEDVRNGKNITRACSAAKKTLKQIGFKTDYVEIRVAETLKPVKSVSEAELRILAAAWLGKTRLIDNIAV